MSDMKESIYYRQAKLLLRILPITLRNPIFALKGGTAINFFIRDLPRLSVDIDLTYTPVDEREIALAVIDAALRSISSDIEHLIPGAVVIPRTSGNNLEGLIVRADVCNVKIEPNAVLRGTIFEPVMMSVMPRVREMFEMAVEARVLNAADIYGGKICAALDRQHPQDLFDVKLLLDNEGLTDAIRKSFVIHLVSHSRPMAELLNPHYQDISKVFENEFEKMPFVKVSLHELEETRDNLVQGIHKGLTDKEKQFIISIKKGAPQWDLIEVRGVDFLPAVQWKLLNISRMDRAKLKVAISKLEKALSL